MKFIYAKSEIIINDGKLARIIYENIKMTEKNHLEIDVNQIVAIDFTLFAAKLPAVAGQ